MWRRLAHWIAFSWPEPIIFNPFEIFLGGLCVVSGLPFLLNFTPKPGSLEALLPEWLVIAWGTQLVLGGLATLFGILADREDTYRFGMTLLGPAAIIYAVGIVAASGAPGLVAAAITLAFGLACIVRWAVLWVHREITHWSR